VAPSSLSAPTSRAAARVWASLRHRVLVRRLRQGVPDIGSVGPVAIGVATGVGGIVLIGVLLAAVLR
jgi:hypothetical protein